MNDFFGFDFVGILILLCILIYLLFDFKGTRKNFSFYSHLIKGSPDEVEEKGKVFLFQ
jgi:hypothetical protein